jgi:hypothetical protein
VFLGRPGNNPYCVHRALEHDKRGERERLRMVALAPDEPFDNGRFEIDVEPALPPAEGPPTILGTALDDALALDWRSGGAAQRRVARRGARRGVAQGWSAVDRAQGRSGARARCLNRGRRA